MNELFEVMKTPCHMMDKVTVIGPFGPETQWKQGAPFTATIVKDNSLQAQVAEKQGVKSLYTITASPPVDLDFHDVIRRDSDEALFRVTTESIDSKPPEVATFTFTQVKAERWEIPQK